ncbi:hypothetical protein PAXINDRAFT_168965 [Paxillus involutus ATCC 200175]|uniref:PH domain-containing protein n=1 Tax=Paxillus involutus ATCC 200175 TaxID=664439 RepID=A0A0C9SZA5_PAXIN|nr:hypothetical protein PAXINDRAFT_168965 [Paxillus involutus ATCC 200175]
MSAQRSSTASPLRDRLLSNSPNPVQSSILRDSAKGWSKSSSPTSNLGTTPLRIAKREGKPPFPVVARRSSSSYKHLRTNNLVSKSPFKTQIPTPSRPSPSSSSDIIPTTGTRRVSGEKRPRPDSMHEQAENERPLAFKRERRQSKAYQGLIEKEPVTKSPFKRITSGEEEQPPPPVPPKPTFTPALAPPSPRPSPPTSLQAAPSRPITPSRPSIVSKRLHGPRAADQPSLDGKRQRRKTVTFDERCDVLEFDRDEDEDPNPFVSSDEDDYGEPDRRDGTESHRSQGQDNAASYDDPDQDSFESVQLGETDQSITGIVDAMMQSVSTSVPGLGLPSTPSRLPSLPADLETEDGVPYGRSHHAERTRRRASVSSPAMSIPGFPFHNSDGSEQGSPSTPPRTAESSMDISSVSEVPLGRLTHVERARQDHEPNEVEEDDNMMSPSPSPAKKPVRSEEHSNRDSLIPRFELQLPMDQSSPKGAHAGLSDADPFSVPRVKEEAYLGELSFTSFDDPANLSIGQSEVSLSNLDLEAELQKVLHANQPDPKGNVPRLSDLIPHNSSFTTSTPPPLTPPLSFAGVSSGSSYVSVNERGMESEGSPTPHIPSASHMSSAPSSTSGSPAIAPRPAPLSGVALRRSSGSPTGFNMRRRSDSPLNFPSGLGAGSPALRSASPGIRAGSPLRVTVSAQDLQGAQVPKTRISREDVQMRLMRKRSTDSPLGSPGPEQPEQKAWKEGEKEVTDLVEETGKEDERRQDNVSVMTEISAEFATIETAEKRTLNSANVSMEGGVALSPADNATRDGVVSLGSSTAEPVQPRQQVRPSFGMLETSFDISGGLGLGLRDSMGSVQLGEMRSALDRLMDDVNGSSGPSSKKPSAHSHVRVETVTEGVKAGQFNGRAMSDTIGDESLRTETDMDFSMDDFCGEPIVQPPKAAPIPMRRAATDSAVYTGPGFRSPVDEYPDAPSAKDAIRAREELILEKRRAARRRDDDESMGYYTPPRPASQPPSTGRPSRRRSRSTGDAGALMKSDLLLDIGISETEEELLADSITKELRKLDPDRRQGNYRVREHEAIFASADAEQVSHMPVAGDVNGGKAWKAVRRPSDMNEYAKQIKEYRSQEKPGKAHGKVFVRVLGVKGLNVPIPQHATALACTLNNGIHFVTTPETRLTKDARINQEFELIEHNKLEFTLTLKIRRDPHITAQFKALAPPAPPPQPVPPPPKPKGGMFSFLSSSPKKPASRATPPPPPVPHKLPDNLARYLKQDGTLARAFISFKDVAARCDARLFELSYPLIGQRVEASGGATTMELGEIVLQLFRLPSLPGVLSNQLPQSLDECLRGLKHVAWHKVTYFEGTLTQNGGDCTTWRRRKFRVTGANLIAFNDVTKKATATINLKKAVAIEDTQDARLGALSRTGRYRDDYDSLCAVERSFRLVFPGDQEILFFADSDEEKARWLEVLRALVGHIPPNPLWAELIWQRQQEVTKQPHLSSSTTASS